MKASEIKAGDRVLWKGREVTVIDAEPVWRRSGYVPFKSVDSSKNTAAVLVQDDYGKSVAALRHLRPLTDAPLLAQRKAVEDAESRVKHHARPDREIVDALVATDSIAAYSLLGAWEAEHGRLLTALETEYRKLAEMEAKR